MVKPTSSGVNLAFKVIETGNLVNLILGTLLEILTFAALFLHKTCFFALSRKPLETKGMTSCSNAV